MRLRYIWLVFASAFVIAAIAEAKDVAFVIPLREAVLVPGADFPGWVALCRPFTLINTPEAPQPPESPEPPKAPPVSPEAPESPEKPKSPDSPETPKAPRTPEAPEPPESLDPFDPPQLAC